MWFDCYIKDEWAISKLIELHENAITEDWNFFKSKLSVENKKYIISAYIKKPEDCYQFSDLCAIEGWIEQ